MAATIGEAHVTLVTCILAVVGVKLSRSEFSISELIVDNILRYNCTIDEVNQFHRIPKNAIALRLAFSSSHRIDFENWIIPPLTLMEILEIDVSFIPQPLPNALFINLKHLKKLTLYHHLHSSLSFSVQFPKTVFHNFLNLTALNLPALGLELLSEDAFRNLAKLRSLDLNQNRLVSLPPGIFDSCCQNVIELNLAKNHLTSTDSLKPIRNLSSLRQLNLYGNRLYEIPALSFLGMANLTDLNLEHNLLERLESGAFVGLISLKNLYIEGNLLTNISAGMFDGITRLRQLDLSKNRFIEVPSAAFSTLNSLKELSLRRNNIRCIAPGAFDGLNALQVLELQQNTLSVIDSASFKGLDDLRALYLDRNQISVISRDVFVAIPRLSELYLSDNALQFLPEGFFAGARWLSTLDLSQNLWACDRCDVLWLVQWTRNNTSALHVENRKATLCASPLDVQNQSIFDLQVTHGNGSCATFLLPTGATPSTTITSIASSSATMPTINDQNANQVTQIVIKSGFVMTVVIATVFLLTWCNCRHRGKWHLKRDVSSHGTTTT